jgi:soluble lytic murein transglycosylase-like protein
LGALSPIRSLPAAIFLLGCALVLPAHAAERILLDNGFEMHCHHHGEVAGKTRLYLNASEDNFIELRAGEIASVEQFPDPPAEAVPAAPAPNAAASTHKSADASLSPEDLREMLSRAGHAHNLDVDLLASLVKAESGGNAHAVSRAGARGLMQLMPATASGLGVQDSFEPTQNVRGGSAYLDALLIRYHDNLSLALAAYNAGPAAVDKYHGIPPYRETRAYVARVIHEFNRRVLAREAAARRAQVSTAQPGAAMASQ